MHDGSSTLRLQPGVETLTITGAEPGTALRVDRGDTPLVTVVADGAGNAHVAFVPTEHGRIETAEQWAEVLSTGELLAPGPYTVVDVATGERHGPVTVLAVGDVPDESLYDQELAEGFGYLEVRDGVTLSIMVRFPNEDLYGPAPWPTVIEYSGYGPSNPDAPQPGTLLANLLGFAVVGVNMRGTGCSGGVFDVFSPAQAADGYDVVETVARQPWVLDRRVGMVGLSYPGISQLYVAATQPPSLAAITPLSVIDDLWRQQWPGGTYNSGFTRSWLAARDAETKVGGQAWDQARIDAGDAQAAANQAIRSQNFDFERFGRAIDNFRPTLEARRVESVLDRIDVPVYLTGAWQDEQTGSRFALMLDRFHNAPHVQFTLFNGHHPDGYSPMVILRWFEFLSFHVGRRVPVVPELIRMFAPMQFAEVFGVVQELEADRYGDLVDDFDAAFARFTSEPPVRIMFESGAGTDTPGATGARYEVLTTEFPPPGTVARRWWFGSDGTLGDEASAEEGFVAYTDDLDAGEHCYAIIESLQDFTRPTVPLDWTWFEDEHVVRFETEPLTDQVTVAGQGHVHLWLRPGTEDTSVQVTLTEIRPDGMEVRVQSGWHRPVHRVEDPTRSDDLRVDYTFTPDDREPLVPGELIGFRVPFMPLAHVFRAGSRIRVGVSTPGRDMPLWCYDNPVTEGAVHEVGVGGTAASSLVLPVWDDPAHLLAPEHEAHPPADALRGQPARRARPVANTRAGLRFDL
ncbi:MAG TPA: CocE/NonD family hydrolase [Microthrixaceae bacterium]|nr:CocE/NonD family hydrolase [Microthrixaceae bacterium]